MNKAYYVEYHLHDSFSPVKGVDVLAQNKEKAYEIATFEKIPAIEGTSPYSAWVASVTYNNGNYRRFNTFEGKPY
jgi:hypothetical protein